VTSPPIKSVAADANVLLAPIAGRAARRIFAERSDLIVVTTEVTAEVHRYVPKFAARYRLEVPDLHEAVDNLPVRRYDRDDYASHVAEARRHLERRDPDDIALGALALKLSVPISSNDNDLREVPLTVYTTAQLLRALGM
jgi:predicted nucleic acid-binding protein